MKKQILIFTVVISGSITNPLFSSQTDQLDSLEQNRPTRSHSQLELLDSSELAIEQTIITNSSKKHLDDYRMDIEQQCQDLTMTLATSQKARIQKKVCWAKFHAESSGKLRGAGYIVACLSSVAWVTSLTPLPCEVQNWMGIGATVSLGIGGALIWLAKKSEETSINLDNDLMGEKGRLLHKTTLIDQEIEARYQKEEAERRRLLDEANLLQNGKGAVLRNRFRAVVHAAKEKEERDAPLLQSDDPLDHSNTKNTGMEEVVIQAP